MKNLQELPRLTDSISYIYIEHAIIEQEALSIVAVQKDGRVPVPISALTCLMLGPGTTVTHAAIRALNENGCMVIWCGEGAGRFYACGTGETRSARNLLIQAKCCMDADLHMSVVRKMYDMRFPDIKTGDMSLQQIRGLEGIRVKKIYELMSRKTGVKWDKRNYKNENWESSSPINKALSQANALLYGLCHAAIVSLGFSPGLGFIHTGKQLSFVYDIADLYKAETTIPAAFDAVKSGNELDREVRVLCRRYFANSKVLSRIANDLNTIFQSVDNSDDNKDTVGSLWDEENKVISGGINYGDD